MAEEVYCCGQGEGRWRSGLNDQELGPHSGSGADPQLLCWPDSSADMLDPGGKYVDIADVEVGAELGDVGEWRED